MPLDAIVLIDKIVKLANKLKEIIDTTPLDIKISK
jgi:hypothetical protein